ncbi:hypothetical protein [Streptomyces bacillaris]|uniref:hypothetical protein n=1 Tax=Streptomyces bacillaris TaxID=68179 RepID=UPI00346700BF
MARQLARGMGSFSKDCGCAKPTRCPHLYSIRFRDALGKQREESGYATQDDVIETPHAALRGEEDHIADRGGGPP